MNIQVDAAVSLHLWVFGMAWSMQHVMFNSPEFILQNPRTALLHAKARFAMSIYFACFRIEVVALWPKPVVQGDKKLEFIP